MKNNVLPIVTHIIIASGLAMPLYAAAEPDSSDEWRLDGTLYLWGAAVKGETQKGGNIDMSFNEVVKHLDLAFMAEMAARKGKWSLFADLIYMKETDHDSGNVTVPYGGTTVPVALSGKIKLSSSIVTAAGGYNLIETDKVRLDAVAGVRYFSTDVDLRVDASALGMSDSKKFSDSENLLDGIVGAKGFVRLGENLSFIYYADVGSGQSKLTWQAMAGAGYNYHWGELLLAYRYLDYKFDSDFALKDLSFSGPALGARFMF
jgi:hypothetical protein